MKPIFIAASVGLNIIIVVWIIVSTVHPDYRSRAEFVTYRDSLSPIIEQIEVALLKGSIIQYTEDQKIMGMDYFEVTEKGTIIFRMRKYGQLGLLIPSVEEGKIKWRCIAAPRKDVSTECRG